MEIVFAAFDETGRSRIAQLTNKSNQFNLTTRRYSEKDIAEIENDPSVFTLQVRLRDRFGDAGMISVLICRDAGEAWEIDTWLMSCRVLGRGVEDAVLAELVRQGASAGKKALIGRFILPARTNWCENIIRNLVSPAPVSTGGWILRISSRGKFICV